MPNRLTKMHYKLVALSSLGGALEFLDFTIYVLFARYISQNFFPAENHVTSLVNTFAVFAIGYLARPLGGVIFGHYGDKYGRKNAFTLSAFVMALATLLIGCLPSYKQIGVTAPLLLLVFRLMQGISLGGEVPGATVFISEHFPPKRRGLAVGLIFMGVTLGNVIGSGMGYILTHSLSNEFMLRWGFRIPFIVGFALGIIAYILRKKSLETPMFKEAVQLEGAYRMPMVKVIRIAVPQLITGFALTALSAVTIFIFLYLPSYPLMTKHYKVVDLYFISIISFLALAIFTAIFGFLSDFTSRKKLIILGSFCSMFFGYFLFKNFLTSNVHELLFFCISLSALVGMVNGCYGCAIAFLFPTKLRYSGMGVAYNLGFAIFGGLAPFIITLLLKWITNPLAPYYLFLTGGLITLIAAMVIKQE